MKYFISLSIAMCILIFSLKAQFSTNSNCYAVAHNNGANNALFKLDGQTNEWAKIGLTGTNNIRAIATDPINKIIYAADGGTFGKINPQNGLFTAIGAIGTANGDYGPVTLNDITGLTFDPINMILYATHHINSGDICSPIANTNDLLFQINVLTGKVITDAMLDVNAQPTGYAVIEEALNDQHWCNTGGGDMVYDVDDIAYNPYSGELYAIQNYDDIGVITIINPYNGSIDASIYTSTKYNIEGIGFNNFGQLYAAVKHSPQVSQNNFIYIDLEGQQTEFLNNIDSTESFVDFEAFDGFTAFNNLALTYTQAPNNSTTFSEGSTVTLLTKIYNQGNFTNTNITLSNSIPNGLTLNDANWLTTINGNAVYTITDLLEPGESITIPITFTIHEGFAGQTITASAEIYQSFGVNLLDYNGQNIVDPLPNITKENASVNIEAVIANTTVQLYPCYTVAHNNGASNTLLELNVQTNQWVQIGRTGTNSIKAIATDPINNVIYAIDGGTFGKINPQTGLFSSIGTIGTANGDYGPVILNNISGLTFDPVNNVLYATHYIYSGDICYPIANSNDLLFQIDISSGKVIPNAMVDVAGNPAGYSIIEEAGDNDFYCYGNNSQVLLYDIDGIAYNSYTNELHAIQSQNGISTITIIETKNGSGLSNIYDIDEDNLSALGFNYLGNLYSTVNSNDNNSLLQIDINTQSTNLIDVPNNTSNKNLKAFDCFTAFNDLALSYKLAPNNSTDFSAGKSVTFLVNIYNQGNFTNTNITLTNYIPNGLILNDANWISTNNDKATFTITDALQPGDLISVPVTFTIDAGFEGEVIKSTTEISQSAGININENTLLEQMPDIDSYPDDYNNEIIDGDIIVDNEIYEGGPSVLDPEYNQIEDEDDHDIAVITINAPAKNLSLSKTVYPAKCNETGAALIDVLNNGVAPYTHKWFNELGDLVYFETNSNSNHFVSSLPVGIYNVIVHDAFNKISEFTISIPFLAKNNGNVNCDDSCPAYLTTTEQTLHGTFQAQQVVEIKGFVDGSQDALFRICN